jgi:Carboxypeptidase regulatory-like domain/TonB-dependent Receptor Plug Domain
VSWIVDRRGVLAGAMLVCSVPLLAQVQASAPRAHRVRGVIIETSGTPVADAEVWLVIHDVRVDAVRTGDDGKFQLSSDSVGNGVLRVRRLGYERKELDVSLPSDDQRLFTIALDEAPARLEEVRVAERAEAEAGYLHEFYERSHTNSFGHFYTPEAISNSHAHHMSELLRNTPGVRLTLSRGGTNVVRARGCLVAPMMWVDGMRVPDAELDELARPDDIAAMEVYLSPAGVPAQYMDRTNGGCGTILVWTRHE